MPNNLQQCFIDDNSKNYLLKLRLRTVTESHYTAKAQLAALKMELQALRKLNAICYKGELSSAKCAAIYKWAWQNDTKSFET